MRACDRHKLTVSSRQMHSATLAISLVESILDKAVLVLCINYYYLLTQMCKYPAIVVNHTIFSFLFHLKELMRKNIHDITAMLE